MTLPTRKHLGCDDMCPDCVDTLNRFEVAIQPVIRRGLRAFWRVVRQAYPGLLDEQVPANSRGEVEELELRASEAVLYWLFNNWNDQQGLHRLPKVKQIELPLGQVSNEEMDMAGAGK